VKSSEIPTHLTQQHNSSYGWLPVFTKLTMTLVYYDIKVVKMVQN